MESEGSGGESIQWRDSSIFTIDKMVMLNWDYKKTFNLLWKIIQKQGFSFPCTGDQEAFCDF